MIIYTFTTLNDPQGTNGTVAIGINDAGQIVGDYIDSSGAAHGFLYSNGTYITIDDALGTEGTIATGINDVGQIVGYYTGVGGRTHGFLYSGGVFATFNVSTSGTYGRGINDAGQIVGDYIDSGGRTHGFLYSGGTTFVLADPLGPNLTTASGINDAGQIVGEYIDSSGTAHGFLYSGGTYTTIDDALGTKGTVAIGINDAGQIVGDYIDSSGTAHGFLYSNGTYTTIDDALGTEGTIATGINDVGQIVGYYTDGNVTAHGFLANAQTTAQTIQNDYLAITRTALPLDQATTIADAINTGTQTETQYVNGLLSQVANTTIPAVAVEASMYDATGTSDEITSLTVNFLPAQVANATHYGLNPLVYACEVLGLAFAFGNETGSTAFSNNFGPSNSAMPNTAAGDAAFATAASSTIFGSASTANLVSVMQGFVSNWEAFYTAYGLPGKRPDGDQIDLAARGAAWGDMVGVALASNLGPLNGEVVNFLEDAAQGTAVYGASLVGQPAHHHF